jgi:hypothetical protein
MPFVNKLMKREVY